MMDRSTLSSFWALVAAAWLLPGCPQTQSQPSAGRSWWDQEPATPQAEAGAPQVPAGPRENLLARLFGSADTSGGAEDGHYTILLYVCRSPSGHVEQAKYFKEATEKHAGWKHLYIVHKEDHSLLYWGKYKSVQDARANLKTAKEYRTPAKVNVYAQAIIVPLPGTEDDGPEQWRLDNTPDQYVYTVLIAEFYDVPEADYVGRKKYAVEYCKRLRDGGYPAYCKHDETTSIVTIGLFDASAVVEHKEGNRVRRIVRDPAIQKVFKDFPDLAVNGLKKLIRTVDAKTRQVRKVPAPTYLTIIPREKKRDATPPSRPPGDHLGHQEPGQAPGDPAGADRPGGPGNGTGELPKR